MLRSMSSAISGMQAFQTDLDTVGNNIANVNTVGFKSSRTDFSDILSQTTSGGNAPSGTGLGGTNPMQVGLGVKASDIELDMSQGPDQTTSNPTDLAVNGSGMFVVSPDAKDTAGATTGTYSTMFTRAGNFTVDNSGNLVLPNGFVAMGFPANSNGTINTTAYTPTGTANLQKMNVDDLFTLSGPHGAAGTAIASAPDVQIGSDGSVSVAASDGNRYTVGYISLANFPNTAGLQKAGDNLFTATAASGQPTCGQPGDTTKNLGTVTSGELEMSNVDLSNEFAEMITAQNGYVANTHMIGTDNQVLQALVNMKNS
ncbi:flagellar hook-basal body complex protein [Alicyclobacillus dauci]|uniref:Flagellar hook protein FlgE n=1 Tax=Alicyclobacillus dauci TaxID=1475485 RepID=A0ABY6YZ89_9BACL|nr:flagellar hook-basal body complex protein [Alicyclobacillus dauci]WAH35399.1 flagellar hook-basal body complex protein [Alicyclobacillus dauci]